MISIRLKIILIIIFCTLTLGGVIAFFSISKGADLLEEQAITLILSNTRNLANKIESENNKIESIMSTVATVMANNFQFEIAKVNKEYIEERINYLTEIDSKLLEQSNRSGGGVMSIYATFNVEIFKEVFETWHTIENGVVTLMEDEPLELFDDPNNPDMAWYFDPIRERRGVWTTTYEDALTRIPMYSFVEPAIDNKNNIIGIVGMDISLEGISEFVSSQKTIKNGFSFLIDRDNKFIVNPQETISQSLLESLLMAKDTKEEGVIFNEQAIIAYSLLPNKQVVATYVNRSDIFNDIYALRINLIFFSIIMIVLSAILGFVLIAPIISRINKLKDAATTGGDEKTIMEISNNHSNDEIGQLTEAFNNMLQKIKKSQIDLEKSNHNLEKRVQERTLELERKIEEMKKFSEIIVNRELKMIELKKQIKKLSSGQEK
ncbi:hypothetical protein A2331_00630 [Candidatus Falkowbacteria bacterium RIFOXYB2_FULL_34_18]|uniref:histidine kinase n=1 Tax=Candidatus Falkowbacteria bacterium RIFOXYD2_FULL_34_120 TaxID=1798007 RepID=A0A1F5TLZ4_9BACT|nr:MAG: hypothetical protein A2331_00630 [Candidatus Falkowbacteria bacterium RIFOXYB2_FULL_34_18]OGF29197.1 MAG: hypothetical protein A2500_05945 [Candidatus Falkowbacteria bacterium RIFOXYC12_FULL_34_55]OGF37735.1 MAG: hypothetical protein A2466_06275 [Candidatus Falkowbacteria bacterium RIFOXYC2_FULL_34_220]OGF38719.1 MAG: hypothetical protein A2515_01610 [Candidatus Falkowbacteria bacterium RIFOXYD12_FULL_34_57]OGF39953.1 MAG: hypothetical protein A2531_01865 [Candidatus Falkowbacteria bact